MKILTFTTLYPDATRPRHGIFIENRVRHLVATGNVSIRVVAPCPWFPLSGDRFGKYGGFARIPPHERRGDISVYHPRYPLLPKFGMSTAPFLMYRAARRFIHHLVEQEGDFDLIDAHYFYPDGVAAVMLARYFHKPVTVTARGSDLNILPRYRLPRRLIRWAASHAQGLCTVSEALREELFRLGIPRDRIRVLRNGVDLEQFRPLDRIRNEASLRREGVRLLSVGNLVPVKGHAITIRALIEVPSAHLTIVGEGPDRSRLGELAQQLGVAERVVFLGNRPHGSLAEIYNAADILVLSSRHEGWPNVLLEAMACGTPVVVSDIPGMSEIVCSQSIGRLFRCGDPSGLARAVTEVMDDSPGSAAVRTYAERFSWQATTTGQLELFRQILNGTNAT